MRASLVPPLLAALLLAGCGGGGTGGGGTGGGAGAVPPPAGSAAALPAEPPAALPAVPGIEAEVVRWRSDVAAGGRVQVTVTNTGSAPFTVSGVALASPGFAAQPPTPVTAEFAPGRRIALPTPFGDAVCTSPVQPAGALLVLARPGGAAEQVRVPLAGDALDAVHAEQCAVAGVLAVVDVGVVDLVVEEDAVRATVVLRRTGDGDEPVTVEALGGSMLFDLAPDRAAGLPLELAPGAASAELPVVVTSATCEPHVLAESKQPFVFPLEVAVGGLYAVRVLLPLDDAQRAQLSGLVDRACAG